MLSGITMRGMWGPSGRKLTKTMRSHTAAVSSLARLNEATSESFMLSGAADCTVRLWDPLGKESKARSSAD